jgi:NADH:ubiquinone oxidoreductase subunit K
LSFIQAKCNYRIYVYRNYAECSQSLFVAFSTYHQDAQGQILSFSMAVAAAEVAVGLAILVSIFRNLVH